MFGTGGRVVIFLEFLLAAYSAALVVNTDQKVLKIVHGVFGIMWVVLALMNIFS